MCISTDQSMARKKIVIVGAGIAGLAAAKTLQDKGFEDYLLIEAQAQVGGRIHSIPWDEYWIDCGAQFLHGDKSKLAELCYSKQLLTNKQFRDGDGVFLRNNGLSLDEHLVQEVDDFIQSTLKKCEDCEAQNVFTDCSNIGIVLRSEFKNYLSRQNDNLEIQKIKEEIFDWNIRFLQIDNSCNSLDELSVKNWGKFKFVDGSQHILFKAGYNSLTNLIASDLKQSNLCLNTAVEFIEWQESINANKPVKSIAVILSDRTEILADCVIVTSSLGYLKENHARIFCPPLPVPLRVGIESLGFGLINKIFLDFGTPWWKPTTKGFQFLWNKCELNNLENKLAPWTRDITGFDVLQDHDGILLGWVGGYGAYTIETLTEEQIAVDCANLLRHYLKLDNNPVVKRCKRTQWHKNKYVRGSYSHISTGCDKNGVTPSTLSEPIWGSVVNGNHSSVVPIIMFAGEATHENFYSTTHGAYDTGVKQAQTFLQYHVNNAVLK